MRALGAPLRERGCDVVFCDDHGIEAGQTRWNTMNPSAPGNLSHVLAVVARAAAAHPGQRVFLCGASFGCRVLAELLRTRQTELPDSVHKDALVCAGYPLHKVGKPEGADPKRANHLLQLPKSVHTLFLSGDRDEFLGARGLDALRDVMARMAGATTLAEVPGGEHTVPMAKGLKALGRTQAQVNTLVVDAICDFTAAQAAQAS